MAFLVIHMGLKLFGAAGKNNSQNCEMVKTEQVFTILAMNPEGYNKRTECEQLLVIYNGCISYYLSTLKETIARCILARAKESCFEVFPIGFNSKYYSIHMI